VVTTSKSKPDAARLDEVTVEQPFDVGDTVTAATTRGRQTEHENNNQLLDAGHRIAPADLFPFVATVAFRGRLRIPRPDPSPSRVAVRLTTMTFWAMC
jgi:hypothetical protein